MFVEVNVGVDPKAGSLLYWQLRNSAGAPDIRMNHLGCPVVYGNKWIANKWVRWSEQMNRYSVKQSDRNSSKTYIFDKPTTYEQHF